MDAGKVILDEIDFNLRDLLEQTLKTLAPAADAKGLELLCDVVAEVPESVRADSVRLRQVLVNLVGNAIKFTSRGEVTLRVESNGDQGDFRVVHFTVADTGIGIPPKQQAIIFDPFTQADASTTRKYGGTGLGLAISARLVSMLGGKIWLNSVVGRGSEFHFSIPLKVVAKRESPVALPPAVLSGMKVLIVDDNRTNQRIVEGMLKPWQARTMCVGSGQEALAELSSARELDDPYQLLVTDMHMPEMDGFALVEEIRRRADLSLLAIMMLTSAGHGEDLKRCKALGVVSYLFKPVRKTELLLAILAAIGKTEPVPRRAQSLLQLEQTACFQSLQILLAEDNSINQAVAVHTLKKMGHSVVVAHHGREALALLQAAKFDLVLMDIQMPEMDGLTATRSIRKAERRTGNHVPIIAMTAHAMKGDRERCLEAGMDGYIAKPITARELAQAIDAVRPSLRANAFPDTAEFDPTEPVNHWDPAQTLERLGGDENLLQEVMELFVKEAPIQLANVRAGIAQGNAEASARGAHSLKGELGYFDTSQLSQKARELEESARARDLERAAKVFASFEKELSAFIDSMRETQKRNSGSKQATKVLGAGQ
jgi:two-component system, sensor histidine kinase and response regulator